MAVGDWSAATLADAGDVKDRYKDALSLATPTGVDSEIETEIALAKEYIGRRLDVKLQDKWQTLVDDSEITDLKDLIANPEVLKDACVAHTLMRMFQNAETKLGGDTEYNAMKKKDFKDEFRDEFNIALALLQYDEDVSGDISAAEKAGGVFGNRMVRV